MPKKASPASLLLALGLFNMCNGIWTISRPHAVLAWFPVVAGGMMLIGGLGIVVGAVWNIRAARSAQN
jgi:uncharacterized membrane protein HdeD (DUF308 family)